MRNPTDNEAAAIKRINADIAEANTAIQTILLTGSYSADNGQQMTQADIDKLRDFKAAKIASLRAITKRLANG